MQQWDFQNTIDVIEITVTIASIVAGASVIVWQMGRQNRDAINLQLNNSREELKLKLYETLVEAIREVTNKSIDVRSYLTLVPEFLEMGKKQLVTGQLITVPQQRASEYSQLYDDAHKSTSKLIEEFEAWRIVFPEIELFQLAINSASYDAHISYLPLFEKLMAILPNNMPNGSPDVDGYIRKLTILDQSKIDELRSLIETNRSGFDDICCYVGDLQVEAQNRLLSTMFDNQVPQRIPLDPKHKVIGTDPDKRAELVRYFEEETAWGRAKQKANNEVSAEIEKPEEI